MENKKYKFEPQIPQFLVFTNLVLTVELTGRMLLIKQ